MYNNNKIAITLRYDGSAFHGWQVQKNSISVQQSLQDAIEKVVGFRPDISGCSRTDSGVHAMMYVCHMQADGINIPMEKLPRAINAHLNPAASVYDAKLMPNDFHARYSCKGKEYVYKIWNSPYRNPFLEKWSFFVPVKLDIERASFCCEELCGTHDFTAFMSQGSKITDDTIRTVTNFSVDRNDELITITVSADGFLYNMVRIMTGTYIDCALGRLQKGDITKIINERNRSNAGDTAPAHGLYLNRVFY